MSLLSPGIYMRSDAAHWPWPIDLIPPGRSAYLAIAGPHHYAPDAICDIMSVKSWRFTAAWGDDDYSFFVDEVVNAGTAYGKFYEDAPVIFNLPGWADLNEAVEKNPLGADSFGIAGIHVAQGYAIDPSELFYANLSIELRAPGVGYSDAQEPDPEWRLHVGNSPVGFLQFPTATFSLAHASIIDTTSNPEISYTLAASNQLEYLGETIGEEADGWTITVAVEEYF
jgi:hypothetical protein